MKSVSVTDLQLIPELSGYSIFDFLNPKNDEVVNEYLYEMGFDVDKGVEYTVSYHRNWQKQALVGYVIVGEMRNDWQFKRSSWCSAEDRLIAAGSRDLSLAKELAAMMNIQIEYGSIYSLEQEEDKEFYMDQEDIDRIEDEMELLEEVMKNIRGEQHKKDGSLKRPRDYHEQESYEKVRRKKKNRTTLKHREREMKREQQ